MKMLTTAAGSVVAMMAPSNKQTATLKFEMRETPKPTNMVHMSTATTAKSKIGAKSPIILRTFMASAVSNNSTGKKTTKMVSEGISKACKYVR